MPVSRSTKIRDRRTILSYLRQFWQDKRTIRLQLKRGPRTLAEALYDSGALQMPTGGDRYTGCPMGRHS